MPKSQHAEIPIVETERLVLRGFTIDDLEAFTALRADPDVIRHLPGGEVLAPFAREVAEARIKRYRREWARGYGVWALVDRATGQVIGYAGIEKSEPGAADASGELLYALAKPAWGHGLAREAARACLAFGFERAGRQRIAALSVHENLASQKVLRAIGMRPTGPTEYNGFEVLGFEVTLQDWRALDEDQRLTG